MKWNRQQWIISLQTYYQQHKHGNTPSGTRRPSREFRLALTHWYHRHLRIFVRADANPSKLYTWSADTNSPLLTLATFWWHLVYMPPDICTLPYSSWLWMGKKNQFENCQTPLLVIFSLTLRCQIVNHFYVRRKYFINWRIHNSFDQILRIFNLKFRICSMAVSEWQECGNQMAILCCPRTLHGIQICCKTSKHFVYPLFSAATKTYIKN